MRFLNPEDKMRFIDISVIGGKQKEFYGLTL
jgi:hypothetical protein